MFCTQHGHAGWGEHTSGSSNAAPDIVSCYFHYHRDTSRAVTVKYLQQLGATTISVQVSATSSQFVLFKEELLNME